MSKLRDPFNPTNGAFNKNVRTTPEDDSELRESLKALGWVKEFPALADENGVVIVGHRRIKLAKELKIDPVIETINFGKGDIADAERLKLAIASNVGFARMTKEDRQRIAEHLYGEHEWTMQRIAEALGVTQRTISEDLRGLEVPSKPSRAKGGRPKGSTKPRMNESIIAEMAAAMVLDQGKTYYEAERQLGVSNTVIRSAVAREEGRREVRNNPPIITPEDLSFTARQKFEASIRQYRRQLEAEFEQRVLAEANSRTKQWLEHHMDMQRQYEAVIKARPGFMSKATYELIRRCLHPDSRAAITDRVLQDAFAAWTKLKLVLVAEKDNPTVFPAMPRTVDELLRRKAQVAADRQMRRSSGRRSVARR